MRHDPAPRGPRARLWLTPSAALERFSLDADANGGVAAPSSETRLRYGVELGSLGILLPPDVVSDVIQEPRVFPLPKTAQWVHGLLNLRGNLIPVFDLRGLLGNSGEPPQKRHLVVVDRGENAVGFFADSLPRVADTSRKVAHLIPLPDVLSGHVEAAYVEGEAVWLEVSLAEFIASLSERMAA